MTSRLKHKLELENINLKSSYLNESFVQIGTPLPELASTKKDQLEYVPVWQQEVRDEQGRRRFHGAWTGGFSAGYFNSVGSKEGWAPSEFKSSRGNRASKVQRPEDFMDEEDVMQMNQDRKLENTETFRDQAFAGERRPEAGEGSLSSALESLIAPAKSSIGQTLLQKLGWRPGQGIGPRVSLRKLRIQEGKLGKQRARMVDKDEDEDMEASGSHTFAPRDNKLVVYSTKGDKHGLGYQKGRGMGKLPQKRDIFGTQFEEDGESDPYAVGSSTETAFVFDNGDEDEVFVMGGPSSRASAGPSTTGGGDRWHDGRPVLAGFTLDPLNVPTDKWFEIPEIPPDWRPRPARIWGTTRKFDQKPDDKPKEKEVIRGDPRNPLTFEQRGAALGEEQRVSQAKSVWEYISEKDRQRLEALAAQAKSTQPPPPPLLAFEPDSNASQQRPSNQVAIPPLSPRTASAALKGFIPYGDDLQKQERYRSYLISQTYNTASPNPTLRTGTIEEINKELDDFAASARIFKPLSFAMSSRFTSGSSSLAATDLKQPKAGLHIYDAEKAKEEMERNKTATVAVEEKKFSNPREQAAADGRYGELTRTVKMFYPVKLLCRRFGVQDPHPEGEPTKIETGNNDGGGGGGGGYDGLPLPKNDASWEDNFIHKADEEKSKSTEDDQEGVEHRPRNIGEVGMADDINQGRDTLSYTKPSIDIFKAIFASDDEDDNDDEDEEEAAHPAVVPKSRSVSGGPVVKVGEDPFPVKDEGPVDLATFKPVFNARKEDGSTKAKDERKKDKKDKKKRKGALSFAIEDEGAGEEDDQAARREEKKRRRREREDKVYDSQRGGESAGASVTTTTTTTPGDEKDNTGEWVEKAQLKPRMVGRLGASDFM